MGFEPQTTSRNCDFELKNRSEYYLQGLIAGASYGELEILLWAKYLSNHALNKWRICRSSKPPWSRKSLWNKVLHDVAYVYPDNFLTRQMYRHHLWSDVIFGSARTGCTTPSWTLLFHLKTNVKSTRSQLWHSLNTWGQTTPVRLSLTVSLCQKSHNTNRAFPLSLRIGLYMK